MHKVEQGTLMALQVPAQIPGTDAALEFLFKSEPGRLMLVVMVIAILANVATVWLMLRWFRSNSDAADKVQLQLITTLDKMNTTIANYQSYTEAARQDNIEQELTNRTNNERTKEELKGIADKVTDAQKAVGDLLIEETTLHAQTRQATIQMVGSMVDEIMTQRQLDLFQEFNNPRADDCRWRVKLISSAAGIAEVQLQTVPIMKDNNFAGFIRGSGEIVKIIEDIMLPGWAIVQQLYGDSPAMGYVRRRQIVIADLPIDDTPPLSRAIIAPSNLSSVEESTDVKD